MLDFKVIKPNRMLEPVFESTQVYALVHLYQISNLENTRNERLTAEVGTSREKDLIAYICHTLKNKEVDYKINNEAEEDLIVSGRKISIKHSSNKSCSGASVKVHWAENKNKQSEFIKTFEFTCDILLVFVRFSADDVSHGNVEFLYFSKEMLNHFKKKMNNIFKTRNSNGRGIEFSKVFFDAIVDHADYHLQVRFELESRQIIGPIDRRLQIILDHNSWGNRGARTVRKNAARFFSYSARLAKKCFVCLVYKCKYMSALIWLTSSTTNAERSRTH
jgi:hypothetical protein